MLHGLLAAKGSGKRASSSGACPIECREAAIFWEAVGAPKRRVCACVCVRVHWHLPHPHVSAVIVCVQPSPAQPQVRDITRLLCRGAAAFLAWCGFFQAPRRRQGWRRACARQPRRGVLSGHCCPHPHHVADTPMVLLLLSSLLPANSMRALAAKCTRTRLVGGFCLHAPTPTLLTEVGGAQILMPAWTRTVLKPPRTRSTVSPCLPPVLGCSWGTGRLRRAPPPPRRRPGQNRARKACTRAAIAAIAACVHSPGGRFWRVLVSCVLLFPWEASFALFPLPRSRRQIGRSHV